jgi:hypothetical protein
VLLNTTATLVTESDKVTEDARRSRNAEVDVAFVGEAEHPSLVAKLSMLP